MKRDTSFRFFDNHELKIERAIQFLKENKPEVGYLLAFSGGKDSCVILDLAKKAQVKFIPVYAFTTIDPPELVKFIRKEYPEVIFSYPKKSFFQYVKHDKWPLPDRKIRWCCQHLKENEGKYRTGFSITGVRTEESKKRSNYTELAKIRSTFVFRPILHWSEYDVWKYIEDNNIPYCSLYDEGFDRLGCVVCPLCSKKERLIRMKRWPKIWDAYKRAAKTNYEYRKANNLFKTSFKGFEEFWQLNAIDCEFKKPNKGPFFTEE